MHYFLLFTDFSLLKIKQIYKAQELEDPLLLQYFSKQQFFSYSE